VVVDRLGDVGAGLLQDRGYTTEQGVIHAGRGLADGGLIRALGGDFFSRAWVVSIEVRMGFVDWREFRVAGSFP